MQVYWILSVICLLLSTSPSPLLPLPTRLQLLLCDVCILTRLLSRFFMQMKHSCWMMHYNLSRSHWVKPATTSPGSTMQTGLSSSTVGGLCVCCMCLCVCVIYTCVAPSLLHPSSTPLPSILITPSLAFTGLTEFVHVSPTPVCDLLPCYTTWQRDECSRDSLAASNGKETRAWLQTRRHALQDPTESLSLYLQHCWAFVQQFSDP